MQKLYVDGNVVASAPLSGPLSAGSGAINGSYDGRKEFFKGTMDEVALYNATLSGLQVKNHYDAGVAGVAGVTSPNSLTAIAASTTQIDLQWNDNSNNETGFVIQRSLDSRFSSATEIQVKAGTTTHRDPGVSAGTTYHYRVKAVAGTESSGYSNSVSAQTLAVSPVSPPPAPTATPGPVVTPSPTPDESTGPTTGTLPVLQAVRARKFQDLAVVMRRGLRLSFDARHKLTVKVIVRLSARDARRLRLPVVRRTTLALPSGDSSMRLRLKRTAIARLRNQRRVALQISVTPLGTTETRTTMTRSVSLQRP